MKAQDNQYFEHKLDFLTDYLFSCRLHLLLLVVIAILLEYRRKNQPLHSQVLQDVSMRLADLFEIANRLHSIRIPYCLHYLVPALCT